MTTNALTAPQARRARKEFLRVLSTAALPFELGQMNLFTDEAEAYIKKEVERMLYEPKLPAAGDNERRMISRLEKLAADKEWEGATRAYALAQALKVLLAEDPRNPGRYYSRKPLTPYQDKAEYAWVLALKEAAKANKQWDRKWFAEQRLLGWPTAVSNFKMECLFLLRNSDGLVTRLVRLKNIKGEVSRGTNPGGSEVLDARSFSGAEKFSEWCLGRGNFVWDAGVTELRMMQADIAADAAWRVVNLVESVGWHAIQSKAKARRSQTAATTVMQEGLWFFDECAYVLADGVVKCLRPDEDNIIWHEGEGYFLAQKGRESQFLQKRPMMKPDESVLQLEVKDWVNLPERSATAAATDTAVMSAFFREMCERLEQTIGDHTAWLALGAMFSYGAAPELFRKYGLFPGLFIHGLKGSGKTNFTSWLMGVWGFNVTSGVSLGDKTSTAVGMLQELENNSNLPVWFDEFRDLQIDPGKSSIIRNAYDRTPQAKWSPDGKQRAIKTAMVVSGESTTSDAATRSRYPHVQVSANKRRVNHLRWFAAHREKFFFFGREIMSRRGEFVEHVFRILENWLTSDALKGVDEREKLVHGIGYASWLAMMTLLESHTADELGKFRTFMIEHSKTSAADVGGDNNINVFWTDVVTAFEAGAIPLHCFYLQTATLASQPGVDLDANGRATQGYWDQHQIYIDPDALILHLKIFLTKSRGVVMLNRNDLRDQVGKEKYWIPGPHTKRFTGKGTRRCWGISVDDHWMGSRVVSDSEHSAYLLAADEGDPRKGQLFSIVDALVDERKAKS